MRWGRWRRAPRGLPPCATICSSRLSSGCATRGTRAPPLACARSRAARCGLQRAAVICAPPRATRWRALDGLERSGGVGARPRRPPHSTASRLQADGRRGRRSARWRRPGRPATSMATTPSVQQSLLTYANHPAVTSPMSNTRLDAILANVSVYLGQGGLRRGRRLLRRARPLGNAQTFGSINDGLDTIDNNGELNSVLNNAVARVKVVRIINYCGGPGTNIIGCAWIGGDGMSLVRYGNESNEGQLWAHEYGHNVGLGHNGGQSLRHVLLPLRHQLRADADGVQPLPHAGGRRRRRRRSTSAPAPTSTGTRCRTRSTTAPAPPTTRRPTPTATASATSARTAAATTSSTRAKSAT